MKYSNGDAILAILALFQWLGLLAWAHSFGTFGLIANIGIFLLHWILFYYNPIVITHNFLHTPFFRNQTINHTFSIFNSMNLGLPQILYRYHHLTHHRHHNRIEDPSSTKRYGKSGEHENWISYCAFSLFRDGTQLAWAQVKRKGEGRLLYAQIASVSIFILLLGFISPSFLFKAYLPLFFGGWFLAHMENYFEHYRATDENSRYANSVSYNGKFYNLLMFNEGLHQEHHIAPQAHWSERPKIQQRFEEKMGRAGAYRSKFPPLLGFLD